MLPVEAEVMKLEAILLKSIPPMEGPKALFAIVTLLLLSTCIPFDPAPAV